jgi:steroid 5-alpha reductase family enzyme
MIIEDLPSLVLTGWLISALIMVCLWLLYLRKGDPSVVDIGWGGSIGCASCWMFLHVPYFGTRQRFIALCVAFWSLRLLGLLISRMAKGQKDRRYVKLSARWQSAVRWKYFLFFQAQALSVGLLLIPIALSYLAPVTSWTLWDAVGFTVFMIGITGEMTADQQMARFRADPGNRKKVCNVGLWRYSRHPNYFFEWVIWMSYAIVAMNHPAGFLGWISPAVILFSILKITGIPPTEQRLLESKGEVYGDYQTTTSAFIPMPPRSTR